MDLYQKDIDDMLDSICRFCSQGFPTWEKMRNHQKKGKCPKDKPLPYDNGIAKSKPLPEKPREGLGRWL